MSHDVPLIEGEYAEGAYGPTILLVLLSVDATKWLGETFERLAHAAVGTVFRLDAEPGVSIAAAPKRLLGIWSAIGLVGSRGAALPRSGARRAF